MNVEEALLAAVEERPIAGLRRKCTSISLSSCYSRHEQAVLTIIQEIQNGLIEQ